MALAFFKSEPDKRILQKIEEQTLDDVKFNVFKLNSRIKPKKRDRIVIVGCFSEFGCETIGCMYSIPRIMKRFPGRYIIVMGWYGREYLYRHLVDEFWEIDESFMWLREYARAFHHISGNLKRIEESASIHGTVIPSSVLGRYAVGNFCKTCGNFWHEWQHHIDKCPRCESTVVIHSAFTDIKTCKKSARAIPKPKPKLLEWARSILKPNTVGIFARGRKTYGRNLEPEFYVKLIELLESMGHNVIWLGEKQSTQPCPVDHVMDFSRMPESRSLEKTLAIVCNLDYTVQFWTASTRLAGMMGVPYLLFESPEQIYCSGLYPAQEGRRLELATFGNRKVVIAHYLSTVKDTEGALGYVKKAVDEMKEGNFDDMIGLVDNEESIKQLQEDHYDMLREQ